MSRSRAICLLSAALSLTGCAQKPVLELLEAKQAQAAARDAEADIFAPDEYQIASSNLQSAIDAIEREDAEPMWARSYSFAHDLLDLSVEQFGEAVEVSDSIRLDAASQAEQLIPTVQEAIDTAFAELEQARKTSVVSRSEVDGLDADLVLASQLLKDSRSSQQAADYVAAVDQSQQAIDLAEKVRARSEEINLYAVEVELELQQQASPPEPENPFESQNP